MVRAVVDLPRRIGTNLARLKAGPTYSIGVISLVLALAGLPLVLGPFTEFVATRILVIGLFALAYNITFGYGGMPSLGHAAFFGVGSYVAALGVTRWAWGPLTIWAVTVALGACLGALFGFVTQRSRGMYFLLLTLAMAQAIWGLAFQQVSVTRGDNGIAGVGRETILYGPADETVFYYYCLVVVVLCGAFLWVFTRSGVGQAIVGIRESESRMAALGYRVALYRTAAMTVSGLFSAIAGMLFAFLLGFVGPDNLFWITSAVVLVYAIFGGAGYFLGPALGVGVLIVTDVVVSTYTHRWLTVLGAVYIATVLFLPGGLASLFASVGRRMGSAESERWLSDSGLEET